MKILISGAGGQLGSDCAQVLGQRHDVVALRSDELDITQSSEVMAMMRSHVPDVVLNCAAYTRVDACETEGNLAREVNVKGAEHMARGAHSIGARMIHISTDYVFDGKKRPPNAYVEDDAPNPLSQYGRTKLEGEGVVKACAPAHVIVRTAWLYGITGQNFLKTILGLAAKDPHKEIKVVNDQFGSPTWTWRVAQQISRLMETDGTGIYHVTAQGYGSWYELASF